MKNVGIKTYVQNRSQVRKLYERLQRKERSRAGFAADTALGSPPSASRRAYGPSQSDSPSSVVVLLPPSFVPAATAIPEARIVIAGTTADESVRGKDSVIMRADSGLGEDLEGVPRSLAPTVDDNGRPGKKSIVEAASTGNREGVARKTNSCQGEIGGGVARTQETALEVGERLQKAVRLCNIRGGCGEGRGMPGALTLSESELSRPKRLLESLRVISCRSVETDEGQEKQIGLNRSRRSGRGAIDRSGFLAEVLAEADARQAALRPMANPLMETSWLSARYPRVTLVHLLTNKLELSIWGSYWRSGRATGSAR